MRVVMTINTAVPWLLSFATMIQILIAGAAHCYYYCLMRNKKTMHALCTCGAVRGLLTFVVMVERCFLVRTV